MVPNQQTIERIRDLTGIDIDTSTPTTLNFLGIPVPRNEKIDSRISGNENRRPGMNALVSSQ